MLLVRHNKTVRRQERKLFLRMLTETEFKDNYVQEPFTVTHLLLLPDLLPTADSTMKQPFISGIDCEQN